MSDTVINTFPNANLVFGYIAIKELNTIENKIEILVRLGYDNKEITSICGCSPGVVKTIKYNINKNKGVKKNGKRKT